MNDRVGDRAGRTCDGPRSVTFTTTCYLGVDSAASPCLHGTDEDKARKLNRTENVRPIPPSDPDFKEIYARRSDAESINRGLEDTLYLGRAHSVGHRRQLVNLLGYALMVNSLALHEHRQRQKVAAAA